jgi:hypothetical protein
MRFAIPLACLLLATGAAADTPRPSTRAFERMPLAEVPSQGAAPRTVVPDMALPGPPGPQDCRDRIHTVREERGLPAVERETADPEEPLLIKALDKRVDGCSVMVMHHNTNDIRQLPQAHEPRLMRAK